MCAKCRGELKFPFSKACTKMFSSCYYMDFISYFLLSLLNKDITSKKQIAVLKIIVSTQSYVTRVEKKIFHFC